MTAAVFDFDGLLADTEPLWALAEESFVVEHGGRWAPELRRYTHGRSVADSAVALAAHAGADLSAEAAEADLLRHFEAAAGRGTVPLLPGALAVLAASAGTPLAVASNTPAALLGKMLERTGIRDRFGAVVGAGDALAAKPAPDVYLAACRALGVPPERAYALEDSQPGVDAALAAGLSVIGVNSDPDVRLTGCRRVASLTELLPTRPGDPLWPG
ncbi:HAD superfamily hydrolase (TIGR01509 family) [Nocardia tenerifensis]|uniref:HAD superfamily hydrolase (TIGR01509 family) n=1 Tax=Nocardia tenerifensis TaxID=228006 RepID=A0A318JYR8_9NOCA|nr:HAD family phosphatase [Nocardia tenerifensis]PXX59329.1 HAD superfamily hydrolase (TIGR01509 family) [Nocardia tenerifensis]